VDERDGEGEVIQQNANEVSLENYVQGRMLEQRVDRTQLFTRSANFFSQRKAKTGQGRSKPPVHQLQALVRGEMA
jgi:hypothetical protein